MVNITPETTAEARKVYTYIALNPSIFEMQYWYSVDGDSREDPERIIIDTDPSVCNTTLCLAGVQTLLASGVKGLREFRDHDDDERIGSAMNQSGRALGLSSAEAEDLFVNTSNEQAFEIISDLARGSAEKFYEEFPQHAPFA